MPGFSTHHFFGINAYHKISNNSIRKIIRKHHNAYSLGQQGPDLFFYFLLTSTPLYPNIADKMHKQKVNHFFKQMIINASSLFSSQEFDIAIAYIMGYAGHYSLDTNVHPYIYSRVGTKGDNRSLGIHFGLESDIDRIILMKNKGIRPAEFDHTKAIRLSALERRVIAQLLKATIKEVYGITISTKIVYLALRCFDIVSSFLSDSKHRKHHSILFVEKKFLGYPMVTNLLMNDIEHSADPCNLKKAAWANPYLASHESNESVFELIEKGERVYLDLVDEIYKTLLEQKCTGRANMKNLLSKIGNKSFNTGISY